MHYAIEHNDLLLSTDQARLDRSWLFHVLSEEAYWSPGLPQVRFDRMLQHSLCFGLYRDGVQLGFARAVTDYATFAYLADVVVRAECRGQGLGQWMMQGVLAHPDLQQLRRMMLVTRDAHTLYQRFGFAATSAPANIMEKRDLSLYRQT